MTWLLDITLLEKNKTILNKIKEMSSQEQLIGQGTYGRVFRVPHPQKQGEKALKKQMKTIHPSTLNKINRINRMLSQIDPSQQYFAGRLNPMEKPNQFWMQQRGVSLDKIFFSTPQQKADIFLNWLVEFPQLMQAVQRLQENSLIHGDIKLENILWNNEAKKFYIIDYDMLGTEREYLEANSMGYNYPNVAKTFFYFVWPLERFYLQGGIGLYDYMKQNLGNIFTPPIIKYFYESIIQNPDRFVDDPIKIDIYSLGLVAFDLFIKSKIFKKWGKTQQQKKQIQDKLSEVVFFMLNPLSADRYIPIGEWYELIDLVSQSQQRTERQTSQIG